MQSGSPAESTTTSAVRIHRFGPPDVMQLENVPRPVPAAGEVLIHVSFAGVGPWDALIRRGESALPQSLPLTLGSDLSGIVVATGSGVDNVSRGDMVFGVTNARFTGAYAHHALAVADMIAQKPATLSLEHAASAPVVAVTAWQMLFEHGAVTRGSRVLILGSAGNVGAYAVQLARYADAHVVAMAQPGDAPYVVELGAHEVVGYDEDALSQIEPVDVVIDTVGGIVHDRALRAVKRGGAVVSSVSPPVDGHARRDDVRETFFIVDVTTQALTKIARLFEAGELTANVGTIIPLSDARRAHVLLETPAGRPRGKILLSVAG